MRLSNLQNNIETMLNELDEMKTHPINTRSIDLFNAKIEELNINIYDTRIFEKYGLKLNAPVPYIQNNIDQYIFSIRLVKKFLGLIQEFIEMHYETIIEDEKRNTSVTDSRPHISGLSDSSENNGNGDDTRIEIDQNNHKDQAGEKIEVKKEFIADKIFVKSGELSMSGKLIERSQSILMELDTPIDGFECIEIPMDKIDFILSRKAV